MIVKEDLVNAGSFLKPHALKGELNAFFDFYIYILVECYQLIF